MHSSRMRTARLLTVSCSARRRVCPTPGCSPPSGCRASPDADSPGCIWPVMHAGKPTSPPPPRPVDRRNESLAKISSCPKLRLPAVINQLYVCSVVPPMVGSPETGSSNRKRLTVRVIHCRQTLCRYIFTSCVHKNTFTSDLRRKFPYCPAM